MPSYIKENNPEMLPCVQTESTKVGQVMFWPVTLINNINPEFFLHQNLAIMYAEHFGPNLTSCSNEKCFFEEKF